MILGGHPVPFERLRAADTSFLCPGTPRQPEAMHCSAGLQDFLQWPMGWTGLCENLPQRTPCCLARVRPRSRQEGCLLKANGALGRGPCRNWMLPACGGCRVSGASFSSSQLWDRLCVLAPPSPASSALAGMERGSDRVVTAIPSLCWPWTPLLFAAGRNDMGDSLRQNWDVMTFGKTMSPPHSPVPHGPGQDLSMRPWREMSCKRSPPLSAPATPMTAGSRHSQTQTAFWLRRDPHRPKRNFICTDSVYPVPSRRKGSVKSVRVVGGGGGGKTVSPWPNLVRDEGASPSPEPRSSASPA